MEKNFCKSVSHRALRHREIHKLFFVTLVSLSEQSERVRNSFFDLFKS